MQMQSPNKAFLWAEGPTLDSPGRSRGSRVKQMVFQGPTGRNFVVSFSGVAARWALQS